MNALSTPQEIQIELYPGQYIAAQKWGNKGLPVLAIHGLLDNAGTFERLIPMLTSAVQICAVDLPGHGLSSHKPVGQYFHLTDMVIDLFRFAELMGWKQFVLLGHSLGACIASIMAGTFPERMLGVALIDGLGPLTKNAEDSPIQLKRAIEEYSQLSSKKLRHFHSIDEAVSARMHGATEVNYEGAEILLKRGLKKIPSGWEWATDPRLLLSTPTVMTEDQVLYFLSEISSPTCLILPKDGYPFPVERMQARMHHVKSLSVIEVTGEHHVHLEQPELVAPHLNAFFNKLSPE